MKQWVAIISLAIIVLVLSYAIGSLFLGDTAIDKPSIPFVNK